MVVLGVWNALKKLQPPDDGLNSRDTRFTYKDARFEIVLDTSIAQSPSVLMF